ncbi:MAG: SNF2-related protein [Rhodocyclaceae bacterium]
MFKLFKRSSAVGDAWQRRWTVAGIHLTHGQATNDGWQALIDPLFEGYLIQLTDDGYLQSIDTGEHLLPWDGLYAALRLSAYKGLSEQLALPPFTAARPVLASQNSLTDYDFAMAITGWRLEDGLFLGEMTGPVMNDGSLSLMPESHWYLLQAVIAFSRRPEEAHNDLSHREAWARIRKLAQTANAHLDDFLFRSVVVAPEQLSIHLRRSTVAKDDQVIEVTPSFDEAPPDWLNTFDRARDVRGRYDIPTEEGIVQVLITPKVRGVLEEIKRMDNRRVAGSRAQSFILNPYSLLGEGAHTVIDETQFEAARSEAGLDYERFSPVIERNSEGFPTRVGLLIETASVTGPTSSETHWFENDVRLESFVRTLQRALACNFQLVAWEGYDLLVQGETERHLVALREVLEERVTPPILITYDSVHDLSGYSARIEGIGVEKPYYSAYIAKKKEDDGWFPENVQPLVVFTGKEGGEPIAVPTSRDAIEKLKTAVEKAEQASVSSVSVPWLPQPVKIEEAKDIVMKFEAVFNDVEAGSPPREPKEHKPRDQGSATQLILRANIQALDYEEQRRDALLSVPTQPKLPSSIRPEYSLLPHQREGVAWLQHLYYLNADFQVRGGILADDMGLGKTFQLLTFMASLLERHPDMEPMLVVAPVSLLENWAEEAKKFFLPDALSLLTAYGDALKPLRVSREQIDQKLLDDVLVKFLQPGWVGSAKVVLTTYETLRDLEFSFAAQKWSVMVCDEAQRIKNPAAMVTRAAKKQNVNFKIACTGTPVENTLADLWCLFDFVQPGLLGALNDFGDQYRRAIEAKTEDQLARVADLRAKVSPQVLRRLKKDVIEGLPKKVVVEECRSLPLSALQRSLYANAVEGFKRREEPGFATPFKNHLALLHYLRLVCTDPRPYGLDVFKAEPLTQYREKSPKLDWMLIRLHAICSASEKAIIFCEFREMQRMLKHYLDLEFGIRTEIINGDSATASTHARSRQKLIKRFQDEAGFGVLILSPVAVGFGVNIQAANHVFHFTRTWNPAKEDQATDRAYRIGQRKTVFVYYLTVTAQDFTTFDEKLDRLLSFKRELSDDLLNGYGDVTPGDFNVVEIVPDGGNDHGVVTRITLDVMMRMNWQHFECFVGALWSKLGYDTYRTPGANDNGVDVVALDARKGLLIQAKTSSQEGALLGWEAVKDVVTGAAFYQRRHPKVSFGKVGVTNQFFSAQAKDNAQLNGVELLDQTDLGRLLEENEVTLLEVERMLYSEWN